MTNKQAYEILVQAAMNNFMATPADEPTRDRAMWHEQVRRAAMHLAPLANAIGG